MGRPAPVSLGSSVIGCCLPMVREPVDAYILDPVDQVVSEDFVEGLHIEIGHDPKGKHWNNTNQI